MTLIVAAVGGFLLFQSAQIRRSKQLGVIDDVVPIMIRTSFPVIVAAMAAIWVASYKGIPNLVMVVAICAIAAHILMSRTRYGAQLYAIGGNPEAARLAGIDVRKAIFINFVIAGLAYGITGILLTARVSGSIPGSAGLFLELDAIAAAIIGGTALAGGRGYDLWRSARRHADG